MIFRMLRTFKERAGPLWWYAALMFVVTRMGDVVNMLVGLWLAPKFVPEAELGALLPMMNFAAVYTVGLSVLLLPVPKFMNTFATRNETGKARALVRDVLRVTGVYALGMVVFIFWTGDAVLLRLKLENREVLWLVAGFALITALTPVLTATQQAFKLFRSLLVMTAALPYVRLAGMLIFLPLLAAVGYMMAQLGAGFAGLLIAGGAIWLATRRMGPCESYRGHLGEMARYALPLVLGLVAGRFQQAVESLVIRQRLPEEISAAYYYVVMFGAIPMYFIGAITPFFWSLVSERFEKGERTEGLMWQSLAFTFALGGGVTLLVAFAAPLLFRWPGDWAWKAYADHAGYIWVVCLMNVIRSGTTIFTAHEAACRRFGYLGYVIPFSLVCTALLYVLPGWSVFKPYLPRAVWAWCDARIVVSLDLILGVMMAYSVAVFAGMVWQLWRRRHCNSPSR